MYPLPPLSFSVKPCIYDNLGHSLQCCGHVTPHTIRTHTSSTPFRRICRSGLPPYLGLRDLLPVPPPPPLSPCNIAFKPNRPLYGVHQSHQFSTSYEHAPRNPSAYVLFRDVTERTSLQGAAIPPYPRPAFVHHQALSSKPPSYCLVCSSHATQHTMRTLRQRNPLRCAWRPCMPSHHSGPGIGQALWHCALRIWGVNDLQNPSLRFYISPIWYALRA